MLEIPSGTGKIIGLAGVRRSGKTFLFFDKIRRLADSGTDRRCLLYLNFDDDRLHPIRPEEFDLVLRSLRELYPDTAGRRVHLFLDEVQSAPGWERWARRLQDTEDVEIFVTGSSSSLLRRDLSAALRGRSVTLEVFPLSFREHLSFRGVDVEPFDAVNESRLRSELESYLQWGGFPEVVLADAALRPLILEEYASLMLIRDLVERHDIRNERLMRTLLRHCYRNTATMVNVSKLHRDLASMGLSVAKNTLHEYLSHLEDAFLIFLLPKQETSIRKQEHNPKKLHVIDPGLISAFKAYPQRDIGHKLETAVFLHVRRRIRELFYHANAREIDLCDGEGRMFVNTCWALDQPDTARREMDALASGRTRWPSADAGLVYHEYAPGLIPPDPAVQPAWRYLLSPQAPGPP
jgi:predicted AAA+ superfamily ATPase